ncbi:hypothetical protein RQP46_005536 [Phenoliferia psychrophenolica]
MTGQVGAGYGPYSYEPVGNGNGGGGNPVSRPSRDSSMPPPVSPFAQPRYSTRNSSQPSPFAKPASSSGHTAGRDSVRSAAPGGASGGVGGMPRAGPAWTAKDAEMDDRLHNPSPHDSLRDRASCTMWSMRGWLNMTAIFILVGALVTLFAGYPIIQYFGTATLSNYGAFNVGGINSTGQVPDIPGLPTLIDQDTPASALTRTGFDGHDYVLAFSDEFNTDGRTFWPGDDPFWEAVDLHYWATGDFEWYDPDGAATKGGNLVLTVTEEPSHGLNFRSGMIQSWNKFCFTGGYVEVNIQLPGSNVISGLWPGAWTMGNLARAGYGATSDGTWPYSYNTCDIGTLKNQTNVAGTGPAAALNSGTEGPLSFQPGQRLSACTCSGGDHPGPNTRTGRGSPEIDIIEAQVAYIKRAYTGSVSQSAQFAPYDASYEFNNATPATTVYDSDNTYINTYKGGVYQQAVSAVTLTDQTSYELSGKKFSTYGWEAFPDPSNGYITWQVDGTQAWQITSASVGPNAAAGIGQRLISEEPMYIIINLGISESFQTINYAELTFPAHMLVDYVRVYQRADSPNIGCDPPNMPTADYINSHLNAYSNPNLTTWEDAGYSYPKNSMTGC